MATIVISWAWGFTKAPRFNTTVQQTAAIQGSVYVSNMVYPVWDYKFALPQIQGRIDDPTSPIANLLGLYIANKGRAGTFLFNDVRDNTVTNFQFGTGDGESVAFQLTRPIGGNGAVDIVQNLNGTPTIKVDGSTVSLLSIDSKGVVTFDSAPASDAVITWSGSFYFMLRFSQDTLADLKMWYEGQWDLDTLEFESVIR